MTTYYGVWSGEEWYAAGHGVFHTTAVGLAKAQAMIVSRWFTGAHWQARAIGEDGLPVQNITESFGVKAEVPPRPEPCQCAMCGAPAKEWLDVRIRGWMCEQHRHVSVHGPAGVDALDQVSKETLAEEQKQTRAEAASHKCGICGGVATNWVELCGCKAYLCDQHEEWRTFLRAGRLLCISKEEPCSS